MNAPTTLPMDIKLMNLATLALGLTFAVLVLLAGAKALAQWSRFQLQAIAVEGQVTHHNALTLRANVAPRLAGTFFSIDLHHVRRVFESVPWVRRAVVHRQFPNRLRVVLQEHQALAYWGVDGELRLINNYGEVFEANVGEIEPETLPRLHGPEGHAAEVLRMYQALEPRFAQMGLDLEQLLLSVQGSWRAALDTGASIELGRGDTATLTQRLDQFLATLTQVTSHYGRRASAVEFADLRHENGYALRLRGVTTQSTEGAKQ